MIKCSTCGSAGGHDPGLRFCPDCGCKRLFVSDDDRDVEIAALRFRLAEVERERDEARRLACTIQAEANVDAKASSTKSVLTIGAEATTPVLVCRDLWPNDCEKLFPDGWSALRHQGGFVDALDAARVAAAELRSVLVEVMSLLRLERRVSDWPKELLDRVTALAAGPKEER